MPTPTPTPFFNTLRWFVQMVWIETPTNPTMKVVDIKVCCELIHDHNKDIVVVVDNTFMSAYFQVRVSLVSVNVQVGGNLSDSPVDSVSPSPSGRWLWALTSACTQPPST